jgi:hypothetical protein
MLRRMAAKKKTKKKTPTKKTPVRAKAKAKARAKAPAKKKKLVAKSKKVTKKAPAKKKLKKLTARRDATGHLNKKYAKELRERSAPRSSRQDAKRPAFRVKDDPYAQELGAEVVGKANSGEDEGEDAEDAVDIEESGGPFVPSTGREEFADGVDDSNPRDAEREPFPTT